MLTRIILFVQLHFAQTMENVQEAKSTLSSLTSSYSSLFTQSPTASASSLVNALTQGNSPFNLAGSLTEIAALTALVGSSTAESLVLGNLGAAGLPWAFISSFGTFSVIRACISAACPGWLRDTLGVRTQRIDESLGLIVDVEDAKRASRLKLDNVIGLMCDNESDDDDRKERRQGKHRRMVFTFDRNSSNALINCPNFNDDKFHLYVYRNDPFRSKDLAKVRKRDLFIMAAALIKAVEPLVLYHIGAGMVSVVGLIGWTVSLLTAAFIQLYGLSRVTRGTANIVSGILPTPLKWGEEAKILLGVPSNVLRSRTWLVTWYILGFSSLATLVTTYLLLRNCSPRAGLTWTFLQMVGVALRSVAFYFGEPTDTVLRNTSIQKVPWAQAPTSAKDKLREVAFTLSSYQIQMHPRGQNLYVGDLNTLEAFRELKDRALGQSGKVDRIQLSKYAAVSIPPYSNDMTPTVSLKLIAVVGDTVLSSSWWLRTGGGKERWEVMFDSCMVALEVNGQLQFVPAARVASDASIPLDPERMSEFEDKYPPRGGSSDDNTVVWWYWIPVRDVGDNEEQPSKAKGFRWMQFIDPRTTTMGNKKAKLLSDAQIQSVLDSPEIFISLKTVGEVHAIVDNARTACECLMDVMC